MYLGASLSNLAFVRNFFGLCTVVVEHDVLRLQVSIDDALLVQVTERHRDLSQVETAKRNKQIKPSCEPVFLLVTHH